MSVIKLSEVYYPIKILGMNIKIVYNLIVIEESYIHIKLNKIVILIRMFNSI